MLVESDLAEDLVETHGLPQQKRPSSVQPTSPTKYPARLKKYLLLPIAFVFLALRPLHNAPQHTLWVYVVGISPKADSKVNIGIYRAQDNFPKRDGTYKHHIVPGNNDTVKVRFEVPFGEYALAASHDLNGNNKLEKNAFGYPEEPFGFSRGFRPTVRGPKFSECAFQFSKQNQLVYLRLLP